jgi:hypothetical protein
MSPAERNQIDAAMAKRAMTGVPGNGYGAMTNAERFLSGREKLRGMGAVTDAEAKGGTMSGYAKGGAAKGAPKSLSVMIAVGSGKAPPFAKKDQSPVAAVPVGSKKVGKVMGEFHKGALHSGSKEGPLVKNPKQAMAIALNEARDAKAPVKKAMGGMMSAPGAGAVSDKEIKTLKKVAMPILAKVAKARGAARPAAGLGAITNADAAKMAGARSAAKPAGPSRAEFDAMMAARNAAPVITPRQRRAMNNETMIGRKTGGSVKC